MTNCLNCESKLEGIAKIQYQNVSSVYSRNLDISQYDILKCTCGLLNTSPRITGHALRSVYENQYAYDFHNVVSAEKKSRALGLKKIYGNALGTKNLFEFGCARGELLEVFKNDGWDVMGCEIGLKAQSDCIAKGIPVSLLSAEDALATYNMDVELVVLSHVLEHLENPKRFLADLRAQVGSETVLMLVVPNVETVGNNIFSKYWGYWQVPVHLSHFDIDSLTNMAKGSGWKLQRSYKRSRDFLGFALTIVNFLNLRPSNTSQKITILSIKIASAIWAKFYPFGKSDLILLFTPLRG
jgi:hypothetical protein